MNIISSDIDIDVLERNRKLLVLRLMLILGSLVLLVFGINSVLNDRMLLGFVEIVLTTINAIVLLVVLRSPTHTKVFAVAIYQVCIMFLFFAYLIAFRGIDHSSWAMIFFRVYGGL